MATLILGEEDTLLQEADFPDYFIDKHHPDDYKSVRSPYDELIYHKMTDHNRIILRICFKITSNMYIPVTFVCDTGAPGHIYVNILTRRLIKSRINIDEMDNQFLEVGEKEDKMVLRPSHHSDVNILGLLALTKFGLTFNEDDSFSFTRLPLYL